ncbi:MAG: chitobiase/beta-hexosaminidase C-terminal domain-containing protein [Candidatus Cloacimonetes bacterium]|nr:chitobiase/beta-hexosaminidase C-terminal domain-containing protein [Candidatus Cloacimonadota bacterium]
MCNRTIRYLAFIFTLLMLSGCLEISQPSPDSVALPVFNPPAGTYSISQSVTITCSTTGATIRFTTDGSEPNINSDVFDEPIHVNQTTIIKAKGIKTNWADSGTVSAQYVIETD